MKKLLFVIALVSASIAVQAQSIGIHAGLNFANGQFDDGIAEDDLKGITGIRIGPVIQFPLGTVFEVHSGAIYSQKGYEILDTLNLGKVTIDYIDIPLNLAASFDLGGIGAYVKAGPVVSLGIGGKRNFIIQGEDQEVDFEFGSGEDETKALDLMGAIGAGIKLGTLQIDATYDFSMSDLSNDEAGFKNKVFHVGLSFVIGK